MNELILKCENLSLHYEEKLALDKINLALEKTHVTALIGPSGCGKSTLLKCFNKMHINDQARIEGHLWFGKTDINALANESDQTTKLRREVGMVFQQPVPFPLSIYDNVAYGLRISGIKSKKILDKAVEESLKAAALWDEVKDILHKNAFSLSGGQQQRLCIARTLAVKPQVLLMDEPTSALDPISSSLIEKTILELAKRYSIIIVTHNMEQASRVSNETAFMLNGRLVEFGPTKQLFDQPQNALTADYLNGRFG